MLTLLKRRQNTAIVHLILINLAGVGTKETQYNLLA